MKICYKMACKIAKRHFRAAFCVIVILFLSTFYIKNFPGDKKLFQVDESRCDKDCRSVRGLLSSWSWRLPRAIIYVLSITRRKARLKRLITSFEKKFRYPYPMVIFHEGQFSNDTEKYHLRSFTSRPLYFQNLLLPLPKDNFYQKLNTSCENDLHRRRVCLFHTEGIYHEPALAEAEYLWHLHDHSDILEEINYDVFKHMQEGKFLYGYIDTKLVPKTCILGLWAAAREFMKNNTIKPIFSGEWPEERVFISNFEVSDTSIWRSALYKKYVEFLNQNGNILAYGWCDSSIKSIFLSMVVKEEQIHLFGDLPYAGLFDLSTLDN